MSFHDVTFDTFLHLHTMLYTPEVGAGCGGTAELLRADVR